MSKILKFSAAGEPREVAPRTYRFVASTEDLDRQGDIIEASAWRLDSYRANPVILTSHDSRSLPVARASRIAVEGGRLMVDVTFPPAGTSRASDEAYGLVASGILRATSVSFLPLAWEPLPTGGRRYTSVELVEVSLVSVPANAQALIAASLGSRGVADTVVYLVNVEDLVNALVGVAARAVASRVGQALGLR